MDTTSHLPAHLTSLVEFERQGAPARFALPFTGNSVQSGAEVSPVAHDPFALQVAAGVAQIHGRQVAIAEQTVSVRPPVPGGHHRLSVIVADATGRAFVVEGLDSTDATYPAIPADAVALAGVFVPSVVPALEHLTPEHIADKRPIR